MTRSTSSFETAWALEQIRHFGTPVEGLDALHRHFDAERVRALARRLTTAGVTVELRRRLVRAILEAIPELPIGRVSAQTQAHFRSLVPGDEVAAAPPHTDYGFGHGLAERNVILERQRVDKVVCLGDLVEKGPEGDRVVETLRRELAARVRGDHDDNAVRRYREGDAAEDDPLLGAEAVAFLEALPRERPYVWGGVRVALSHVAPSGVEEPVVPEQVPKRPKRALRGFEADLLLLGHTHRPVVVWHGDLCIINPGSVAGARPRDSATCAVVELPSLALDVFSLEGGSKLPSRDSRRGGA